MRLGGDSCSDCEMWGRGLLGSVDRKREREMGMGRGNGKTEDFETFILATHPFHGLSYAY